MNNKYGMKNFIRYNIKLPIAFILLLFSLTAKSQEKLYTNEFPLQDVKLTDQLFKHARDLNIQTLIKYDVDRLLEPYLKEAGLTPKKPGYPNWDGLDGHIGGHYLSALSMNYASTGNADCKKRIDYMLSELQKCQDANAKNHPDWGIGYVGGVPHSTEIWSTLKHGDFAEFHKAWVPWYNVHKMYAGLRDAWLYGGNQEAKVIFLKFCDWGINITSALNDNQMQAMLDTEQGGMNEMFADAYQITGDKKYLNAAERFSHRQLLNPMSEGIDNLDNKHANTQVPKAIGFERIGELADDQKFKNAGSFFWETVTTHRSLAFGGNSRREFFPAASAYTDFINDVEGPESCNTYNMLKLTEDLFREHPDAKYMDFYERALYNHILSTQNPVTGGYVYFTPARPRHYRVYSAPNEAMWCCVGSGMENHGKYNEMIYTHQHDSLFLNLFIASQLNWEERKVKLKQETSFPNEEQTKLIVTEGNSKFTLMVRYPSWVQNQQFKVFVNNKEVAVHAKPSSYVGISRFWKKGDTIVIKLPMRTIIEKMPNVPQYAAIMHGPILLGAKTGTQDLKGLIADDSRWGHIPSGEKLPVDQAPILIDDHANDIAQKLAPIAGKPLNFTFTNLEIINPEKLVLEPFYKIHDARYMMYWMVLSHDKYHQYLDSLSKIEQQKIALQKRTIDEVAPGEQQPEVDHILKQEQSKTGVLDNKLWRDASNGGFFSYLMNTNDADSLLLRVQYWGAEWGNRKLDIYIDDVKFITADYTNKWNQSQFQTEEYRIPSNLLKNKKEIRVKFQSYPNSTAGAIYHVWLLKPQKE